MNSLRESFLQAGLNFQLQPPQTLYLIVDGAQIDELPLQLYRISGPLNIQPIYLDKGFEQLQEVSPYLIEATTEVQTWFLDNAKVMQGYFFSSCLSFNQVCEHFRQFIRVETPYGSRAFLKMANAECAWVLFFNESDRFWQGISQAWLPTRLGWKHCSAPSTTKATETKGLLKITDQQWEQLGEISWRNTLDNLVEHTEVCFAEKAQSLSEPLSWVQHWANQAYDYGFKVEQDLMFFINVIVFLGEDLFETECYPDILTLIQNPSVLTPSQRIQQAAELAYKYYQQEA